MRPEALQHYPNGLYRLKIKAIEAVLAVKGKFGDGRDPDVWIVPITDNSRVLSTMVNLGPSYFEHIEEMTLLFDFRMSPDSFEESVLHSFLFAPLVRAMDFLDDRSFGSAALRLTLDASSGEAEIWVWDTTTGKALDILKDRGLCEDGRWRWFEDSSAENMDHVVNAFLTEIGKLEKTETDRKAREVAASREEDLRELRELKERVARLEKKLSPRERSEDEGK